MNKIDIVIPTYNRKNLLERAIISVQKQKYTSWKLYVLDNASTDGTEEYIKAVVCDKIHYVRNESNIGMIRNWYKALTEIGDEAHVVLLSDDDELGDDFLVKANEAINRHPNLGLYTSATYVNNNGRLYGWEYEYLGDKEIDYYVSLPCEDLHYFLGGNPISPAATVVNRNSFKSISDFNLYSTTAWSFDRYWWAQISIIHTVVYCNSPTATYHQHEKSETNQINKNKYDKLVQELQVSAKILNMAINLNSTSIEKIQAAIAKLKNQKQLDVLCGLILFGNKILKDFADQYFAENRSKLISNADTFVSKIAYGTFGIEAIAYFRMYKSRK